MPSARLSFACAAALVAGASFAQTGPEIPAPSPKARVEQRVGVTDFSIDYSSPGVKGREVWGDVVKYDELWRAGANAATKLTASRDFTFGGKAVKAGSYSVFAIPTRGDWTVILNGNPTASAQAYLEKDDVARVTVKPQALKEPRERLAYMFTDVTDDSANLDLEWDEVRIRVPLKVDTKAHVAESVDKTLAEAWRPHFASARYLLDSGGDLDKAMGYVDTSISIKPTWWNNWVRAQILRKQGRNQDAVAAARRASELGKGDSVFENFFKADVEKAATDWNG